MKRILLAMAVLSSSASFAGDWDWSTGGSTPSTPAPGTPAPSGPVTTLVPGVGQSQDKAGAITSFDGNGATIRFLAPNSPLAASGLEVGDRILQINFQPVTSAARYAQLIVTSFGPTALTVQDNRTFQVRTVYVNL